MRRHGRHDEVEREIRDAIEFHLEGMREDGLPIPPLSSAVRYVDIAAYPAVNTDARRRGFARPPVAGYLAR